MLPKLLVLAYAGASAIASVDTGTNHGISGSQLLAKRVAADIELRRGDTVFNKRDDDDNDDEDEDVGDPYNEDISEPEDGDYESTDHLSTAENEISSADELFVSQNDSCVLQPEADVGPYYVENIDLYDSLDYGEEGIYLNLYIQVYDVNTCQVMENALVDMWHANAVGVYSAMGSDKSGNGTDTTSEYFCRGVMYSYKNGIIPISTIFPGHTAGRTNHLSFMVRTIDDGTSTHKVDGYNLQNTSTTILHVGELYFDQDLIDQVEEMYPYNTNDQDITLNEDDNMMKLMQGPNAPDPILRYWLRDDGDTGLDQITAWIAIGVNTSAKYEPFTAANWVEDDDGEGTLEENTSSYETPSYLTGSVEIPTVTSEGSTRHLTRTTDPTTQRSTGPTYLSLYTTRSDSGNSTAAAQSSTGGNSTLAAGSGGAGSASATESGSGSGSGSGSSSESGSSSGSSSGSGTDSSSSSGASASPQSSASALSNGQDILAPGFQLLGIILAGIF